ncbi:hypothetical protein CEXT_500941 [Caerostris extrusa]|uniref:Uncharacterized protein n=1 Tax=Caerostris extrusa TaxID=172846 RepID=A0AAV4XBC4_CAEEX|nr:hypothetical protein CEXT_500941 [Caerostris extrusa]
MGHCAQPSCLAAILEARPEAGKTSLITYSAESSPSNNEKGRKRTCVLIVTAQKKCVWLLHTLPSFPVFLVK